MNEPFPHHERQLSHWLFNGAFGDHFTRTFDAQMWCVGCDIRHRDGNTLIKYGFTRVRPPEGLSGSSYYHKAIDEHHQLHLWGFAVVVSGIDYSLCIRRSSDIPLIAKLPKLSVPLFRPHELPAFHAPHTQEQRHRATELLSVITQEFIKYELFVASVLEPSYRIKCLHQKPRVCQLPTRLPVTMWRKLSERILGLVGTPQQHKKPRECSYLLDSLQVR